MSDRAGTDDTTSSKDERDTAGAIVTVYPDGPLVIRGDFTVCGVDGVPIETGPTVALCRCGRSATKPLCDGGHHRARRSNALRRAT